MISTLLPIPFRLLHPAVNSLAKLDPMGFRCLLLQAPPVVAHLAPVHKERRVFDHQGNHRMLIWDLDVPPFLQGQLQHSYLALRRLDGSLRHSVRPTPASEAALDQESPSLLMTRLFHFLNDARHRVLPIRPHNYEDTQSRARMPPSAPACTYQLSCTEQLRPSSASRTTV